MIGCEPTRESLERNALGNGPRATLTAKLQGSVKVLLKKMNYSEVSGKGNDPA